MLRNKYVYIVTMIFLVISSHANADINAQEYAELKRFCMWKSSAAQTIAMNRDIGLSEIEVIGHYLKQNNDYSEQAMVLYLIEKIYGAYKYVTHDTVYTQTNKTCLRDFYVDHSDKVFVSQQSETYN